LINDSKLVLRVPTEWHRRIKSEAALRGITISGMIRTAVDEWLARNPREGDHNGKEKATRPR